VTHERNLMRAARFIREMNAREGGLLLDGVSALEVAWSLEAAAFTAHATGMLDEALHGVSERGALGTRVAPERKGPRSETPEPQSIDAHRPWPAAPLEVLDGGAA
jgi:hypothetical protein